MNKSTLTLLTAPEARPPGRVHGAETGLNGYLNFG